MVEQPICLCGFCLWPARLIPSHASIPTPHNFDHCTPCLLFLCSMCMCVFIHSSICSSCLLPKINFIVFWHFPLRDADERESLLVTSSKDWLLTFSSCNSFLQHFLLEKMTQMFWSPFWKKREEGITQLLSWVMKGTSMEAHCWQTRKKGKKNRGQWHTVVWNLYVIIISF